jgi:hypothetical protein
LFLAGANHREGDDHRKDNFFFISSVNWVSANSDEENGRPGASQMKPARTAGSALSLLREFFPSSVGLLQRNQVGAIRVTEKAFAAGRTPFQIASVL